jgi:hypothetical protein
MLAEEDSTFANVCHLVFGQDGDTLSHIYIFRSQSCDFAGACAGEPK